MKKLLHNLSVHHLQVANLTTKNCCTPTWKKIKIQTQTKRLKDKVSSTQASKRSRLSITLRLWTTKCSDHSSSTSTIGTKCASRLSLKKWPRKIKLLSTKFTKDWTSMRSRSMPRIQKKISKRQEFWRPWIWSLWMPLQGITQSWERAWWTTG